MFVFLKQLSNIWQQPNKSNNTMMTALHVADLDTRVNALSGSKMKNNCACATQVIQGI